MNARLRRASPDWDRLAIVYLGVAAVWWVAVISVSFGGLG